MLVFIIPLKSKKVSKSWERVSKLLERTLRSLCNQTSKDFRVIVVCNERPEIVFKHPHINYVEVDFPFSENQPSFWANCHTDKGRKLLKGLIYAKRFNPTHVMPFDADDCVSKHLARFVISRPESNGWYMNKGYTYRDGNKFMYVIKKNFYNSHGSCNIIKYRVLNLPENPEYNRGYGYYIPYLLDHDSVKTRFLERGITLEPFPFAGIIAIIKTGENLEDCRFKNRLAMIKSFKGLGLFEHLIKTPQSYKIFNYRLLTQSIREEFGLYKLQCAE